MRMVDKCYENSNNNNTAGIVRDVNKTCSFVNLNLIDLIRLTDSSISETIVLGIGLQFDIMCSSCNIIIRHSEMVVLYSFTFITVLAVDLYGAGAEAELFQR